MSADRSDRADPIPHPTPDPTRSSTNDPSGAPWPEPTPSGATSQKGITVRRTITGLAVVLALSVAACSSDSPSAEEPETTSDAAATSDPEETAEDTGGEETEAPPAGEADGLDVTEWGEDPNADPALVEKALGPVEEVPDIVLASITRAEQNLDQATIDKAMECWSNPECDTGSGGELTLGYADGGGHVNVWRAVSHMEAILQALTYPEIGRIISTEAFWDPEAAGAHIDFLVEAGVDMITGYPDVGTAIRSNILAAEEAGIPYISFSAGWVGLPGQDGALVPGEDYTAVVGEDLCALGESFSEVVNDQVDSGSIAVLGGSPGNALSLGWQQCHIESLSDAISLVPGAPADTFWLNDVALETVLGFLTVDPEIRAYSYEYADGLYTSLQAYEQLGIPLQNVTAVLRTDEQTLFCDWVERDEPTYNIWFSAGGNFQSRTAVTALMMHHQGAELPGEIVVPHVMRQVTADDCNPDRAHPAVSGTSLVPDEVLSLMFTE